MDLIELLNHYRFILKTYNRKEGQTFLNQTGVNREVQKAIVSCFDDMGQRIKRH